VLFLLVFTSVLTLFSSSLHAKDVEEFFPGCDGADISGVYSVQSCESAETVSAPGTVELVKWKSVTTSRGKELQFYHLLVSQGGYVGKGISIFDGQRIYSGRSSDSLPRDNYYIMILGELDLPDAELNNLTQTRLSHTRNMPDQRKSIDWKGKAPWYGFLDTEDVAFGYYFWADGTWGTFSTRKTGWPVTGDSGLFSLRELRRNGEHNETENCFMSKGRFVTARREANIVIDILFDVNLQNNYWGAGFMTPNKHNDNDSILVAMMGGPEDASTSVHEISGKTIRGHLAYAGSLDQTEEVWIVPENVLAKNPKLFK
jgi:hypothetical protein